jgi:hypothetical protein
MPAQCGRPISIDSSDPLTDRRRQEKRERMRRLRVHRKALINARSMEPRVENLQQGERIVDFASTRTVNPLILTYQEALQSPLVADLSTQDDMLIQEPGGSSDHEGQDRNESSNHAYTLPDHDLTQTTNPGTTNPHIRHDTGSLDDTQTCPIASP